MKQVPAFLKWSFLIIGILFTQCKFEKVPVVTTNNITNITISSAISGGEITSEGNAEILAKGVCWRNALDRWSVPQEPTVDDQKTIDGTGSEEFTSNISGLNPGITYYLRAYATNKFGTGYGSEQIFRTLGGLPSVSAKPATNIKAFSARLKAMIESHGLKTNVIFEYGPTNKYGQIINADREDLIIDSENEFSATLPNLTPNTTYHFRIIAENELGSVYTQDQTFKTSEVVIDIDGNTYEIITIGKQVWLTENLKSSRFRDGSLIQLISRDSVWRACTTGAFSSYGNVNANVSTFGALYNWYAVTDSRGLCPAGWHVPTAEEWNILINYLGGLEIAGGKMKEAGTEHWLSPNTDADNSSGFNAYGIGFRDKKGGYSDFKKSTYLWSSTEYSPTLGIARKLFYDYPIISFTANSKESGFSVRCIKD